MSLALFLVFALVAGLMAYVRLEPFDPGRWHVAVASAVPAGTDEIRSGGNWAGLRLTGDAALLARIEAVAQTSPRTRQVAGSLAEGRITWETRSLLWGFPDYTTAEVAGGEVVILARSRFGRGDWGVNAARLADWRARL